MFFFFQESWKRAERCPLFSELQDKSLYEFEIITNVGRLSVTDESVRICDAKPFFCVFKIRKRKESTDNILKQQISCLIGTSDEFRTTNPELNDCRHKLAIMAMQASKRRRNMTWAEKLMYQYQPRIASTFDIPLTIKQGLREEKFVLVAKFEDIEPEVAFTFSIAPYQTPDDIIGMILTKKALTMNKRFNPEKSRDYILKVCGQDEYLFGEHPIVRFLYIQDTLARNGVPTVITQSVASLKLIKEISNQSPHALSGIEDQPEPPPQSTATLRKKREKTSWDISEKFRITIHAMMNVNTDETRTGQFGVQVGLFHGGKSLCQPLFSQTREMISGGTEFNETITFDLMVMNVPRMARLCLVVYETVKTNKGSSTKARKVKESNVFTNPLYWVNTTVFDYKNQLKTGATTLYPWPYAEDSSSEEMLHPLGTVEPNPRHSTAITISFDSYGHESSTIVYPSKEQVVAYAHEVTAKLTSNRDSAQDSRTIEEVLERFPHRDRMHDMHEQERNNIWAKRVDCQVYLPDKLPCLLYCVEWNNRDEISEITRLLLEWKPVSIETALELLDYAYADQTVRRFAVRCLKSIKDEELLLYLLQLVQAIKHESYLNCDLVEFLLDRALKNQRIGHFLFWHLRSEMHMPSVQSRFFIILEAYLNGSQEHIPILLKQMKCLNKMREGSELAKKAPRDKRTPVLQKFFGESHARNAISDVVSPLHPSFRCKSVRAESCKVMDSKMRPLWIVFENVDSHGADVDVIFKNGDDLRQDMLTIQMLRIMDRIWKREGYDFRMEPYSCISMDKRVGMIEVVLNAETIAKIQKDRGIFSATSAFKKGSLLAWLKVHNTTEELLKRAITEFTYSCAGYCVATYVLGIADRHSDNIMVKRTGQLFHIDFGHILGHFKEKFGFRRERVPFVLTHDFVYIINNGKTDREASEFRTFQDLCEKVSVFMISLVLEQ